MDALSVFTLPPRALGSREPVSTRRENAAALLRRLLQRGCARQEDLDARAPARLGVQIKPAAEAVGDDAVDDVQPEARAALITPRREERIEGAAADVHRHAAAIVGKDDLDIVLAGSARL